MLPLSRNVKQRECLLSTHAVNNTDVYNSDCVIICLLFPSLPPFSLFPLALFPLSHPLHCLTSLLISHDSEETICAATSSYENALLAFTVVKRDLNGEKIYNSFVAEIQPHNRVFSLNLDSPDFRKLQFVHTDFNQRSRHGRQQQYQTRLLVVIPDALAAVYTFKMSCSRVGYIIAGQPEHEVFEKNFSWYQWDPTMQWLYYARFESSSSVVQFPLSGRNSLVLHCRSFMQPKPEPLFTVALPLPYSDQYYLRGETYYASPLTLSLPIQEINLKVLYLRNGLWCACLQHANGVVAGQPAPEDGRDLGEESAEMQDIPEGGKLDYTIYIFNNGHMLNMQVPLPMPVLEPLNIHFMVLSGFVVAYIPKLMLHFLNIGSGTDPCHHLAFGSSHSPEFPVSQDLAHLIGSGEILLSSAIPTAIPSQNMCTVIECTTSTHFEISINTAAFLELFKKTNSIEMMEDLLHLTIVGLRHHGMALAMMEHVCQSPMRLSNHRLFSEFLLSFAFANTIFESRRYINQQLPLTVAPTFHGKVFKNSERVTFAMLRLNPIRNFIMQLLVQSDQRLVNATPDDLLNHEVGDKPFEVLCFIAITGQPSRARVNILQEIESQDKHSILSSRPLPPSPSNTKYRKSRKLETLTDSMPNRSTNTLLNRLSQLTRSSFQRQGGTTSTDSSSSNLLKFLKPDTDQVQGLFEEREIVESVITKAISQGLQQRSKQTVLATVRTYCTELENHSCSLLQLIWNALGFNDDIHPINHPIYRPPTALEEIFFELLEAYHLAHQEIGFPTPSGFHTLFATLGFICLSDTLFLQYLRNGVFVPTRAFIELLLRGLQKDKEHVVYEVLCHADQQLATWAFQEWKHPTVERLSGCVREAAD